MRASLLILVAAFAPAACGHAPAREVRADPVCVAAGAFERLPDAYDEGGVNAPDDWDPDCASLNLCVDESRMPRRLTELRDAGLLLRRMSALFGPSAPTQAGAIVGPAGASKVARAHYVLRHRRTNVVFTVYIDPAEGPAYGGSGVYDNRTRKLAREPAGDYFDAVTELDVLLRFAPGSGTRVCG